MISWKYDELREHAYVQSRHLDTILIASLGAVAILIAVFVSAPRALPDAEFSPVLNLLSILPLIWAFATIVGAFVRRRYLVPMPSLSATVVVDRKTGTEFNVHEFCMEEAIFSNSIRKILLLATWLLIFAAITVFGASFLVDGGVETIAHETDSSGDKGIADAGDEPASADSRSNLNIAIPIVYMCVFMLFGFGLALAAVTLYRQRLKRTRFMRSYAVVDLEGNELVGKALSIVTMKSARIKLMMYFRRQLSRATRRLRSMSSDTQD